MAFKLSLKSFVTIIRTETVKPGTRHCSSSKTDVCSPALEGRGGVSLVYMYFKSLLFKACL